jgi:uncharacterized damage-inducible protein DinB
MSTFGAAFIEESRRLLAAEYLPKIRHCLDTIDEADAWWRPNSQCNSIGNLVLHLAGNIRQWMISGVGGAPDIRERQAEFDAQRGVTRPALIEQLEHTLLEVDQVLSRVTAEQLGEQRMIQGQDVTVLEAIYHVVEHFGMHTGQIIYITKLRTSKDLGFYEVEAGIPRPRW